MLGSKRDVEPGVRGVRRAASALGLLLLLAGLVVGADLFGSREALFGAATPPPLAAAASRSGAFHPVGTSPGSTKTVLRSQAWWQEVGRFQGAGAKRLPAFEISRDAIQWRVRWECPQGRFVVRKSARAEPLVDASCGGEKTAELTGQGSEALQIAADGPWTARVEQQVDVPLVEPPLPVMSAAGTRKVATGAFYRIDQVGKGSVTIYRLASGGHALRLDDFFVTANIDLEIRLSPLRAPRTTRQYLSVPAKRVAPLDITAGSMNFTLPDGVDPARYRSVVIWCPLIDSAYAAATLEPDHAS